MKFFYWLLGYCYHDWTIYSKVIQEEWIATSLIFDRREKYIRNYQTRCCNKCGLVQTKDVENLKD